MSWYASNKDLLKSVWMLEAFMINSILIIFYWLEAILADRLRRKSVNNKKDQVKLGTGS